ncbi:MAG: ABC transporter permease [Candidatus Fimivivens sp.]
MKKLRNRAEVQRAHVANLPAIGLILVLLILWQAIAMKIDAAYIIPSPTQILVRLWELREPLFLVHLPATMLVTFVGLLISIVLGLSLAVAMDLSPLAEKSFYPIIIASQTIPTTAIAPLFVLWFGYGIWSKVLVTVLITFFPITISMFDGFRSAKTEMEELMKTYGARKRDIFLKLKLPGALPYFFSAIKMAIPLSIIGAAIGEWLGAQSGLGYFSRRMMTQLDGAGVFAPIVLLSIVAMSIVGLISILERSVIRWRKEI